MNILICGAGYVGLSNALLMSSKHNVYVYDIDDRKIEILREYSFSILDGEHLSELPIKKSNITFLKNIKKLEYDFVVIALPTDIQKNGKLSVNHLIECISKNSNHINNDAIIIVKSTLPIDGSEKLLDEIGDFVYVPEFLREGNAVHDSFFPSRVIIAGKNKCADSVKNLFFGCILNNPNVMLTNYKEAECIKLFSNTYLAMRVAFFNEIDSYMMKNNIDSKHVIEGMGLDDRIGLHYNNPSFGYGGYCLPKDTEEVSSSIQTCLIEKINESNINRIKTIAQYLVDKGFKKIGIYKLSSKIGAKGIRNSSTILLIEILKELNAKVFIYSHTNLVIDGCEYIDNLSELYNQTEIIIANRVDKDIEEYKEKVFTRDIFNRN